LEKAKPFEISKKLLWEAYQLIKSNGGAAGIDGQTIKGFEERLKDNLYKLWNRMSSGSYYPQAVRRVEIPKKRGGLRPLGIPTVYPYCTSLISLYECSSLLLWSLYDSSTRLRRFSSSELLSEIQNGNPYFVLRAATYPRSIQ
jgi:hypothetical protein